MKKISIEGAQNVEVSRKIPSEKTPQEQLAIMEAYTRAYQESMSLDKSARELKCLEVIYPTLFRSLQPDDLIAGRLDFLPIGFGCVTSVGGVGHYCVFDKLRAFQKTLKTEEERARVDALYDFWADHDVKALYCRDVLNDTTTGRFIDCRYPMMATARLSGMMLDYQKLVRLGVSGVMKEIESYPSNPFLSSCLGAMKLFRRIIHYQQELISRERKTADAARRKDLDLMKADLAWIEKRAPETFHQALQLFWLYALTAGCINYGRLDVVLGPYLKRDLDLGLLSEEEALRYLRSLWKLIENRRTTVNGRIIVGGLGRTNEEAGDLFTRLCLKVCRDTRYVEPQFTLRFSSQTPEDILSAAYDCIASGATYPTLYNDDVNVKAVEYAMRISHQDAEQYTPFGCGEYVIQGKSVGTPNTLLNLLKILQMSLNNGIDPMDGVRRCGDAVPLKKPEEITSYQELLDQYHRLLDWFIEQSADDQAYSYTVMNREVSFLFPSILMDDCLARGKALLDGGVQILGGTNETYGNINASDALYAVKKVVFEQHRWTLKEVCDAALADFHGFEEIQRDLRRAAKYGNDDAECDETANDLYEYVAKGVRDAGIRRGLGYYLIVISNNQTNTDWGLQTAASLDGRNSGVYMNPANNPQGGAAVSGPTACLNSLSRFSARYHGGSVQNMRFTPRLMHQDRDKVRAMFRTYFRRGGCQLMVTVVDRGQLEDARIHPEKYPDLIVRVAGYSARFIDLPPTVQEELLSRTLYD
jgi:pyruvate-formate lyase